MQLTMRCVQTQNNEIKASEMLKSYQESLSPQNDAWFDHDDIGSLVYAHT